MRFKIRISVCAAVLFLVMIPCSVFGGSSDQDSMYAGPVAAMVWINGDYNGMNFLIGNEIDEIWLIPETPSPGTGFGGVVGFMGAVGSIPKLGMAMEAGFLVAFVDGTIDERFVPEGLVPGSISFPVVYHNITLCWRALYDILGPLSVYGQCSLGYAWNDIDGAAFYGTETGTVTLSGITGGGGVGLSLNLFSKLDIRAGVLVYISAIESGSGIELEGSIPAIDDNPLMFEAGLTWRF